MSRLKFKSGASVPFVKQVEIFCPFCNDGRRYMIGHTEGHPTIVHDMPYCPEFERLDVLDFMKAARLKIEANKKN